MSWDKSVRVLIHSDSTGSLYTGDIVTGTVTLTLQKEIKIKRIDLKIAGVSKAQWVRPSPTMPHIKIYSEKSKVLSVQIPNILSNIILDNKIPPGVYCYPFHFSLPEDLPSSFESSLASVRYYVKLSSKPNRIKLQVPFNVIANVNVNHITSMLDPCTYEFEREIKGKVGIQLKTYKAVAPRQLLPFEALIQNENSIKISKLKVTLLQNRRFSVQSGHATEQKKIKSVDYKKIVNAITELCYFKMEIPQIVPSNINTTDPMIEISYIIRVEVCLRFHLNIYEDFPITVANVPVIHSDFKI